MPVLQPAAQDAAARRRRRARLELLGELNADHQRARHPGELELDARIASFELAARMQLSATDALDIDSGDGRDAAALRPRQ